MRGRWLAWVVLVFWALAMIAALASGVLLARIQERSLHDLRVETFTEETVQLFGESHRDVNRLLATALPADSESAADLPPATKKQLRQELAKVARFASMEQAKLTDPQGQVIVSSDPREVGHREACVPDTGTIYSELHFHDQDGKQVLCLMRPIMRGDVVVGWLAMHRATNRLEKEFVDARKRMRSGVLLVVAVFLSVCTVLGLALWGLLRRVALAEARARERARLASMGELTRGMAHEVRNPLNSISLTCQYLLRLLERDAQPPEKVLLIIEQLRLVQDEVDKLAAVVDNLMRFARPPEPRPHAASVAGLCRRALELQQAELSAGGVEVSLDVDEDLTAWVDEEQMTRAFINLVRNAVEAMPAGGSLYLAGRRQDAWVSVTVRDTGSGIAPGDLERIFEPDFTTKKGGLGLGLPMASGIVEAHGGQVRVTNGPGPGVTFTVALPADEATYEREAGPGRRG